MKRFLVLMCVALMVSSFAYSSGQQQRGTRDGVTVIRFTSNNAPLAELNELLAQIIEERSGGTIRVDAFVRGELWQNEEEGWTGLSEGNWQLMMGGDMAAERSAQEWVGYTYIPFSFRNASHARSFWLGSIGETVNEQLIDKENIRLLATPNIMIRGGRHITANRAILHPDDIRGLRFRTPAIEAVVASFQAAGANVTPVPWGELFGALQTGLVDAQENPLEQLYQLGIDQVQSHIMLTGHNYGIQGFFVNDSWWQSLPTESRTIILDAVDEVSRMFNEQLAANEAQWLQHFRDRGVTIIERDQIDIAAFQERILPTVQTRFRGRWAEGGWETIQALE